MSNKFATLRGKTSYAKILGEPVLSYDKTQREWTMDLVIDKNTVKELKPLGISDRVKTKDEYNDGQPFLSFRQRELRPDPATGGTKPNDPIKVVQIDGKTPWPQDKLIGNGSTVDVRFEVRDYGPGKKKGVYIRSVRVLDLVPFEREEFKPLDETDEFYQKAQQVMVRSAQVSPNTDRTDPPFDLDDDLGDVL